MSANYQSKSSSKSRSSKEDLDKFDILDIPYASIQPTFDYYLVADYFPTVNNTSDLDFLLEDVRFVSLSKLQSNQLIWFLFR